MNMKKSIAAVSAGAMAISAMATVASANVVYHPTNENATSAREQIVLTYDLATYVGRNKPTTIKIITTYEGAQYLIKGLDIDQRNGNKNWKEDGGSEKGYTVLLGDRLVEAENKNKSYFIQTVELQAWSMDHHNPSIYNDGINGIRNRSKIWYSRATFGKDIKDMQNEAAAVEDHDHVTVIGTDNKQLSEYAFKVQFNPLASSSSGDFILDDFKASESYNAALGTVTSQPEYATLADAVAVKDTIFKAPATGLTITEVGGTKVPYIDSKLEAYDYAVVATEGITQAATPGTGIYTVTGPVINWTAGTLVAGKTQADLDAFVDSKLSPYFQKADGTALKTTDFQTAGKEWYWNGAKFVDDANFAKKYTLVGVNKAGIVGTDADLDGTMSASELTAANRVNVGGTGVGPADAQLQTWYTNAITATGEITKAINDAVSGTPMWTAPAAVTTAPNRVAANDILFQGGTPKKILTYKYWIVKKSDLVNADGTLNQALIDKSVLVDGKIGQTDDLGNQIYIYPQATVDSFHHYHSNSVTTDYTYSFNKFVVTSTFTVNWDDWDKVDNYTGTGANAKFTPIHNGIGMKKWVDSKDTIHYGGQEPFYGTSAVNYSGNERYFVVKPMKSTLNKPADVIKSLEANKDGDKHYTSPVTVLNDVIANNEEVSFEFVSCSKHVRNVNNIAITVARKTPYVDVNDTTSPLYTATLKNPVTNELETRMISGKYITGVALTDFFSDAGYTTQYDWFNGAVSAHNGGQESIEWYNPVFGQHLYGNPTYATDNNHTLSTNGTGYPLTGPTTEGADQTGVSEWKNWAPTAIGNYGSYNYGGWNTNLFNGGLVINSNWTMQINDTKHFDWGNNSIIFFWSDLTAEVKTHATNFLVSMQLYTPNDWYWDTLNVGVGASAAENVFQGATGEGLDNDAEEVLEEEEIVEEEPIDEEEYFEDFEEEEPEEEYYEEEEFEDFEDYEEEEEEPEEEPEEVEVEVKEVPSPKTGNSPIALAVIPVALAAAAIVAKKKND